MAFGFRRSFGAGGGFHEYCGDIVKLQHLALEPNLQAIGTILYGHLSASQARHGRLAELEHMPMQPNRVIVRHRPHVMRTQDSHQRYRLMITAMGVGSASCGYRKAYPGLI